MQATPQEYYQHLYPYDQLVAWLTARGVYALERFEFALEGEVYKRYVMAKSAADLRRQVLVDQIGRQVQTDEYHLKAADEEAQRQHAESGMASRLAQRLAQRLLRTGRYRCLRGTAHHAGERHDQGDQQAQRQQRRRPAQPLDQSQTARQHDELAE